MNGVVGASRQFETARARQGRPDRPRQGVIQHLSRADAFSPPATTVPIRSDLDIVEARQQGRNLAAQLGFTDIDSILIATAISELARNIYQYAGTGEIELKRIDRGGQAGIAVVARDTGPGIANVTLAMQDGFSTSGSLGLGLPGVRRLMDDFDIESRPGGGTTIRIRKWKP